MTINYYAGLDIHKETITLSIFKNTNETPEFEKTVGGDGREAAKTPLSLQKKGTVQACYESGCMGFTLQRYLSAKGIDCIIAATSKIPRRPGDRIKTDIKDARNLAKLLRAGQLTPIAIPTIEDESIRDYLRARSDGKQDLNRTHHRS